MHCMVLSSSVWITLGMDGSHDRGLGLLRAPWVRASTSQVMSIMGTLIDCLTPFRRWQTPDWGGGAQACCIEPWENPPRGPCVVSWVEEIVGQQGFCRYPDQGLG